MPEPTRANVGRRQARDEGEREEQREKYSALQEQADRLRQPAVTTSGQALNGHDGGNGPDSGEGGRRAVSRDP